MQSGYESISGEGSDSDGTKEKIKGLLLEIQELFGISLE